MTNAKFRLLEDDIIEVWERKLYRIESLEDFANVQKGDKGGYLEKEENLATTGDAWVFGNVRVSGNARVFGDADLIAIYPIGSESGILTAFKNKEGKISVTRGCFAGTLEEFAVAVEKTHGDNNHAKSYRIAIELIKSRLEE